MGLTEGDTPQPGNRGDGQMFTLHRAFCSESPRLRLNLGISVVCLLSLMAACSPHSTVSPQTDSPYYATVDDLLTASTYVLLINVSDNTEERAVQGVQMVASSADVIASNPTFPEQTIDVLVPNTPGFAEYVYLASDSEYVIFVYDNNGSEVFLTSPSQGVFPVTGGITGKSQSDSFPLGSAISTKLGLKG